MLLTNLSENEHRVCSLMSENSEKRCGENSSNEHKRELFIGGIRPNARLHLSINSAETEKQLNWLC